MQEKAEEHIYILLGGNTGNVAETFHHATRLLKQRIGNIKTTSSLYTSPSWGFDGPDFLNQVICFSSALDPEELLMYCLAVEKELGRERKEQGGYASRSIDIDILYMNQHIIELPSLVIPHPRIQDRRFCLMPLTEIAPSFIHPKLGLTQTELLEKTEDKGRVEKILKLLDAKEERE